MQGSSPPAPVPAVPALSTPGGEHPARLLEGMALAIGERGYAQATIADVVRHARVSKRTFYEHFADKEDCFFALYDAGAEVTLAAIAEAGAAAAGQPWEARAERATRAYLRQLAGYPALTQTLLIEIQAAGPRALERRRAVLRRFSDLLRALVAEGRRENPELRELSEPLATAVVGGINELVLEAVERGRTEQLEELAGTALELVGGVLRPAP